MSNTTNTALLEEAHELIEELTSHPSGIDKALQRAIDTQDLQQLRYLVNKTNAELSEEHFHSHGIV